MSEANGDRAPKLAFRKVLVANRGEIACRILRTLREMGLASVAVFSDADADAAHVHEADEAVRLGPAPSVDSYLNGAAVIEAALRTGVDAIHPGYGFLAENADFAEAVSKAGLVFVGPSAAAIRSMGDKAAAKAVAESAGVPVLGGFEVGAMDVEEARARVREMGLPVLVKASAGGGGKGMRRIDRLDELESALEGARREAEKAFADGSLLVERYLPSARHVEIQVFGDAHGRIVHLFERDCSVQRRHQKVFEESPSPAVDEDLRSRMGEAAVALARAAGYRGAGTVEFLLDTSTDSGAFYFLEMNTRLQVEHPVTELVTGLDLVRLQIEVAEGAPLPLGQDDLHLSGHAIEARLYAEDPANDYLPATGRLRLWREPDLPGLRIDAGVREGDEIGIHYDPMLAKLVAHGRDRSEALRRLRRGLEELAVGGLRTNRDLLIAVLHDADFRGGEFDTGYLTRPSASDLIDRTLDPETLYLHAIAGCLHLFEARRAQGSPVPAGVPPGWRNNRWRAQDQAFEHEGEPVTVHYVCKGHGHFEFAAPGDRTEHTGPWPGALEESRSEHRRRPETESGGAAESGAEQRPGGSLVHLLSHDPSGDLVLQVDGVRQSPRVAGCEADGWLSVHGSGRVSELRIVPRFPDSTASAVAGGCAAPMTGLVVRVLVEEGQAVSAGDPLVILEAMKMEHRLLAQADGVVSSVRVEERQMVDPDDILVVIDPDDEAEDSR